MLASHVVERVSAPYEIAGHQLVIGVSIGISLAPEDGTESRRTAEEAPTLRSTGAKADGRGTYRFFETEMDARARRGAAGARPARGAAARRVRGLITSRSATSPRAWWSASRRWCAGIIRCAA